LGSSTGDPSRFSAAWSIGCRRVVASGEVGQPDFPCGDDFVFQFLEVLINALRGAELLEGVGTPNEAKFSSAVVTTLQLNILSLWVMAAQRTSSQSRAQ